MKISPVSFGKAVKINGSKEQAFDIARLANDRKAQKSERKAQKEVKAIFDDAYTAPAQVAVFKTRGKENVYIVSGKEAAKFEELNDKLVNNIILAGTVLGKGDKFNHICKQQMQKNNKEVRNIVLNSAENYSITPVYNHKNSSIKSINKEFNNL